MKWISVDDELPEPGTRIIYFNEDPFDFYNGDRVMIGVCGHKEWFANITHWMPLPEEPNQ